MSAEREEHKDKVDQAVTDTATDAEKQAAEAAEDTKKVMPKKVTGKSG